MLLMLGGVLYLEAPHAAHFFSTPHSSVDVADDAPTPARLAALGLPVAVQVVCRAEPFRITPHLAYAETVSRGDLTDVLCGAVPIWQPTNVPVLMHALMVWGPQANFTAEMAGRSVTGQDLLGALLSDQVCRASIPAGSGPFLLDSPYGISPVLLGSDDAIGNQGEAHFGQLLKKLGDAGVSSSLVVETSSGRRGTVADIFRDSVMRFSLSKELEFIACAMVYWLPSGSRSWTNEFNESFSFDDIVKELIGRKYGVGSCGGGHVPGVVALVIHRDESDEILSAPVRQQALEWLGDLSKHLQECELPTGGWNRSWATVAADRMFGDDHLDFISVTGHHLEWMAICPPRLLPSKETVARAVEALRREVRPITLIPQRSYKSLLPISHAGRALALLSGADPVAAFSEAWDTGKIRVIRRD